MAKNIPITARVSKGLFGQKATEPVLNVGQAGVYGNNVTKGDPSPAKMMMKSPLKQMKSEGAGDKILKGQANVSTGSTGPDRVIKGESKTTYTPPTHTPAGDAAYAKMSKAQRKAADEKYKKENTKTVTTPDKVVPGENTKSTEPLKVFNEGSAKTSFWRRQDDRAVTHTSRKKKRADIELSKLEAKEQGLTGSAKRDYINNAKTKAKKEMWESRQSGYKGSRDAAVLQGQQSARVHDKIIGVQVDASKEQTLPVSRTQVGEATKYKMQGQMENKTFTGPESLTATTGGNANPLTGKAAGALADTKSADVKAVEAPKKEEPKKEEVSTVTEKELSLDTDPVGMKTAKGFFAKKSPLKMKYFK